MSAPQQRWRHPGSGPLAGCQVTPRGGVLSLIATLTREGMTVLPAILVIAGIIALARPSESQPAKRVALNEAGGRVRSLAFGTGGGVLAATTLDGTIRCWSIDVARNQAGSEGPALPGLHAAFSPDGATLAVGGDLTLVLEQTTSDEHRQTVRTEIETGSTFALAFSGDGRTLAVAGARLITFRDPVSAGARLGLPPLPCRALALAFAPDARSLATGGEDGYVRIWDLRTGRERVAVRAHVSQSHWSPPAAKAKTTPRPTDARRRKPQRDDELQPRRVA